MTLETMKTSGVGGHAKIPAPQKVGGWVGGKCFH